MFRDLQQHNLQYQQLTDEINATQKRIMTIQDHIKQAKQTIQWQQCRLKSLVQQEATVSTSLFTETSPIDTINTLMEQVQRIQTRLCQRRVEYMTLWYVFSIHFLFSSSLFLLSSPLQLFDIIFPSTQTTLLSHLTLIIIYSTLQKQ